MGLFDTLRCDYRLPVPAVQDREFQTKSFETPCQDAYVLHADGTLWRVDYDVEDRSDPNATGINALFGRLTRVNLREVACSDFSGEVEFYTDYGQRNANGWGAGWISFEARFDDGRLVGLKTMEHVEPPEVVAQRNRDALDAAVPQNGPNEHTTRSRL